MKNDKDLTKSRKTKVTNTSPPLLHLIVVNTKAMIVALLAAFFIIFVGTLISFSTNDPIKYVEIIAYVAFFLSFFICGFTSSKLERGNPVISGLCSFAVYIFIILIISLIIKATYTSSSAENRVIVSILTIPCSLFGAFLGNIRIAKRKTPVNMKRKR